MAGLYDGGTTRNQWYGGLDNINEERRPDTKGFSDLTSGDVQHLVARHWNLPDLTAGFQTIDGNALTYFSDVDLRDSGVVAKSTRRQIMQDLRDFRRHGVPHNLLPEVQPEEEVVTSAAVVTDLSNAIKLLALPKMTSPRTRTPSPVRSNCASSSMVNVVGSECGALDGVYHVQAEALTHNRPQYRHSSAGFFFYVSAYGKWTLAMFASDVEVNRGMYRSTCSGSGGAAEDEAPLSPDLVETWEVKPDAAGSANFLSGSSLVFESMKAKGRWRPAPGFKVNSLEAAGTRSDAVGEVAGAAAAALESIAAAAAEELPEPADPGARSAAVPPPPPPADEGEADEAEDDLKLIVRGSKRNT